MKPWLLIAIGGASLVFVYLVTYRKACVPHAKWTPIENQTSSVDEDNLWKHLHGAQLIHLDQWKQFRKSVGLFKKNAKKTSILPGFNLTTDAHPDCIQAPFLLVQVQSAPENYERRQAIRYSWGKSTNKMNAGRKLKEKLSSSLAYDVVFVTGRSSNDGLTNLVREEAKDHHDILLLNDVLDHYRNLTRKTIAFLKWANVRCRPRYVLKTDDDCYVNIPNILSFLTFHAENLTKMDVYTGRIQWAMTPVRDMSSQYYISPTEFPGEVFPPYAAGGGYLFSGRLTQRLVKASMVEEQIPMEDAYIGILMRHLGVQPFEHTSFLPFIYCKENTLWQRPLCDFTYPFVIHGIRSKEQIWLHYNIQMLEASADACTYWLKYRQKLEPPLFCPMIPEKG